MDWFYELPAVYQALIGTLFTWFVTALGAGLVYILKNMSNRVLNSMLGFGAGVMIAASFWSLLAPAIEMAEDMNMIPFIVVSLGFLAGGGFLYVIDKFIPHLHLDKDIEDAEGVSTSLQRSILLVLAITLHNIPEGLAVGVAFGAAAMGNAPIGAAIVLAIGIGLQNFPEGMAVSFSLKREGYSNKESFKYGQLSGMVEPIAGVIGAVLVIFMQPILPFALSFAAGAMIYVVIEEMIPESQSNNDTDIATLATMVGFVIMMILDVSL